MSSQLVDINADGFNDILCGSFSGTPQIVMGGKDGFEKPVDMLDCEGEQILIEQFWNREEEKWDETDRCGTRGHCTSSSMVDWDNDGDLDLILGGYRSGHLFLRRNEGSATTPEFATTNTPIRAGGKALKVPNGLAAPCVVDWNEDGLFDILCGGSKGGVFYFENKGSKEMPEFSARQELIGATIENVYVAAKDDLPAFPGTSWHIDPVDYDGDGDLDLLVGGRSRWKLSKAVELSAKEKGELRKIESQVRDVQVEMAKKLRGKDVEEIEAISNSDDYKKMIEEYSKLRSKRRTLTIKAAPTRTGDFVWVFRRK